MGHRMFALYKSSHYHYNFYIYDLGITTRVMIVLLDETKTRGGRDIEINGKAPDSP
jgi:hypothetical protein